MNVRLVSANQQFRMAIPGKRVSAAEALVTISNIVLCSFIVLSLYFGRELLVPLALSILLAFMLAPLVAKLQRWLGRIGAVLLVVAMMFASAGAVGWVLTRQAIDLANELPSYKENIRAKLRSIRVPSQGPFSRVARTIEELKKELPGRDGGGLLHGSNVPLEPGVKATPVEIVNGKDQGFPFMQVVIAPVLGPLGTSALVLLLLIFMLLQREELRNRIIRLVGQGRISATARAMDDAGSRVSKYLMMQIIVNVTYGIPVAIGLSFIGVPNAILWGALATVLRFIPYVGPWIAAAFPIILSLASSPGWMAPLLTVGLFVVLELVSNNVMEPWLYGASTGVAPIALIVAALVWTWLWGPVGLVLATPLTVCLVVMGRHIPRLAFLSVALSDDEALTPAEDCYQRLLRAGEHDEMELVDHYLKTNSMEDLFESVLMPVAIAAGTDQRLGFLEAEHLEAVEKGLGGILDTVLPELPSTDEMDCRVGFFAAGVRLDQLAGDMLVRLLWQQGIPARSIAVGTPAVELAGWIHESDVKVVCISAVPPSTLIRARLLCSKLRTKFPELRIIVSLWGDTKATAESIATLRSAGADEVVMTLAEVIGRLSLHVRETGDKQGTYPDHHGKEPMIVRES